MRTRQKLNPYFSRPAGAEWATSQPSTQGGLSLRQFAGAPQPVQWSAYWQATDDTAAGLSLRHVARDQSLTLGSWRGVGKCPYKQVCVCTDKNAESSRIAGLEARFDKRTEPGILSGLRYASRRAVLSVQSSPERAPVRHWRCLGEVVIVQGLFMLILRFLLNLK